MGDDGKAAAEDMLDSSNWQVVDVASTSSSEAGGGSKGIASAKKVEVKSEVPDNNDNNNGLIRAESMTVSSSCKSAASVAPLGECPSFSRHANVCASKVLQRTTDLLGGNLELEIPMCPSPNSFTREGVDFTAKKIAWWFLRNEKDPAPRGTFHPELHDEEEEEQQRRDGTTETEMAQLLTELEGMKGDSGDECDKPSTSRKSRKNKAKSSPGDAALYMKVRVPNLPPNDVEEDDVFRDVFMSNKASGEGQSDMEQTESSGFCYPCNESYSLHCLQDHLSSKIHRQNFRNLSLKIGLLQYQEEVEDCDTKRKLPFSARLKPYLEYQCKSSLSNLILKRNKITPEETLEWLNTIRIEDYEILKDHSQEDAKLKLRYAGKWTDALDKKWKDMKDQETKILNEYKANRRAYVENPSSHPDHGKEWQKFWEERSSQLVKQKKDPESHNFSKEWCAYWLGRMLDILKTDAERKLTRLKESMGLDAPTLRRLCQSSAPVHGRVRTMPGVRPYPSRIARPPAVSPNRSHYYPRNNYVHQAPVHAPPVQQPMYQQYQPSHVSNMGAMGSYPGPGFQQRTPNLPQQQQQYFAPMMHTEGYRYGTPPPPNYYNYQVNGNPSQFYYPGYYFH